MNTKEKLDKLAEMWAQRDGIEIEKQRLLSSVYTPEIKQAISDIEVEFKTKTEGLNKNISALEEEVKSDVIRVGETVKGTVLMCLYNSPRITWDTKSMEGYVIDHPELKKFRNEGSPYCSFRKVGK